MADEALALALADCLEALRQGGGAADIALARYPEQRHELEELLRIIELIPTLPKHVEPSCQFMERTRMWLAALPRASLDTFPGPYPL